MESNLVYTVDYRVLCHWVSGGDIFNGDIQIIFEMKKIGF